MEKKTKQRIAAVSIGVVGVTAIGALAFQLNKANHENNDLKVTLNASTRTALATATATPTPTDVQVAYTSTPNTLPTYTSTPDNSPTPEPTRAFNHRLATVPQFTSGEQVATVRGGNPSMWVLKTESNSVTYNDSNLQPKTETRAKNEWVYTGDQQDLNYPMPQSEDEAAQMFGIDKSFIQLIRITHDKNSNSYSPWMDMWPVAEGTVVGVHFIENHGTQITAYAGDQKITLPPGWTAEMYDDKQNANDLDNVSAVLYNDGNSPISFITSGATLWSMANPEALQLEQANQGITATDHYIYNGQQINNLRSASNFASPITATYVVEIDGDGRLVIVGFNIPGKEIISLDTQGNLFNNEQFTITSDLQGLKTFVESPREKLKKTMPLAGGTNPQTVRRPQDLGKRGMAYQRDPFKGQIRF